MLSLISGFILMEAEKREEQEDEETEQEDTKEEVEETAEKESEAEVEEIGEGESDGETQENELKITVDDVKTAPMDYRFPTSNQAKHCFTRYNEFHKCVSEKGEDAGECTKYAKYYRSLCPGEWVEKWNEQRENGTFAGRY